jgi:hypothetical protein
MHDHHRWTEPHNGKTPPPASTGGEAEVSGIPVNHLLSTNLTAAQLDRSADILLQQGRHDQAERLSKIAADLRTVGI